MKRSVGLKADWQPYLRKLRTREIDLIFRDCPHDAFSCGLELGAGDGFQSTLLAPYACRLFATDYRPLITASGGGGPTRVADAEDMRGRVTFMRCDAEQVDRAFPPKSFDLVFSSNMLEHLPDPERALQGIHNVLKDEGIAIHVVPSPFWKLSQLVGFYPNAVVRRLERRGRRASSGTGDEAAASPPEWDNNPKVAGRKRPYLARLLWPAAHGASGNNLREFVLFSQRYWRRQFENAGFGVARVLRGPVSSGYGFGLDRVRYGLERLGLASETIYVTVKAAYPAEQASLLRYFMGRGK